MESKHFAMKHPWCLALMGTLILGCGTLPRPERVKSPSITALPASPANRCEPPGFPFYLPKPLLVISKNFHHIAEPQIGLTGPAPIPTSFDDQAKYAALNSTSTMNHESGSNSGGGNERNDSNAEGANPNSPFANSSTAPAVSPGSANIPSDGLAPNTFFTYEIVFVPDLTQKYVLQVEGGAGEIRAALNLVNGWQFTGLGPYYMKDSSTAQNLLARGLAFNMGLEGASDVINSTANLVSKASPSGQLNTRDLAEYAREIKQLSQDEVYEFNTNKGIIERYAEIYVYEAYLGPDGQMAWRQIVGDFDEATQQMIGHRFQREYLGVQKKVANAAGANAAVEATRALGDVMEAQARSLELENSRDGVPRDSLSRLPPLEPQQYYGQVLDRVLPAPPMSDSQSHRHGGIFGWRRQQVNNQTVTISP